MNTSETPFQAAGRAEAGAKAAAKARTRSKTGGRAGVVQGRRKATYRVGRLLPKSVRDLFRKQGFVEGAVITRWPEIVGESMARRSMPTRLSFPRGKRSGGTLHIIVDGPFATELQHFEPILLEKLNAFYGFGAVARVAITQAPLPKAAGARKPKAISISAADEELLAEMVGGGSDRDLHDALEKLGRQILADEQGGRIQGKSTDKRTDDTTGGE